MTTTILDACLTEDSHDCYWDATNMGNGLGTGYVDIHGQLFDLVNDPSWHVTVQSVAYDCDDFSQPACQPYVTAYINEPTSTDAQPVHAVAGPVEKPAPSPIATSPGQHGMSELPATTTATVAQPSPALAETGINGQLFGTSLIIGIILTVVGIRAIIVGARRNHKSN